MYEVKLLFEVLKKGRVIEVKKLAKVYIALGLLFLYMPIFVLIVFSFSGTESRSVFSGFTFEWY